MNRATEYAKIKADIEKYKNKNRENMTYEEIGFDILTGLELSQRLLKNMHETLKKV